MKIIKLCIVLFLIPIYAFANVSDENCENTYFDCMDQFCNIDEESGYRCSCTNQKKAHDKKLSEIEQIEKTAKDLATTEVERIQLGAKADYVFNNTKTETNAKSSNNFNKIDLSIFDNNTTQSSIQKSSLNKKEGEELYNEMKSQCKKRVQSCDFEYLNALYETKIKTDCNNYTDYLNRRYDTANEQLKTAEKAQRAALLDSYNDSNKYNRGECLLEFKKCMADSNKGGCGNNFENCTDKKVLENKKYICERVTDSCIAVRDYIWDDFITQIEPTLKQAEILNENNLLSQCLTDITSCIQTACSESFSGEANIDACLGNQEMARNFCQNKITPCEKKVPEIWDYVSARLASMRVDSCTIAVKKCLSDENRCGNDFSQCIGLDTESIRNLCPSDVLTACRKDNEKIALNNEKIDDIIQGLLLNIDNKELELCESALDASMIKVCGDAYSCNKLVMDETIGTNSLQKYKIDNANGYMLLGTINWDKVNIKNDGTLDANGYIKHSKKELDFGDNAKQFYDRAEKEIISVSNAIKDAIKAVESDPNVSYCINGRKVPGTTIDSKARFPNLMSQRKQIIAQQALRVAKNNYNKKYNNFVTEIAKEADLENKRALCDRLKYQTTLSVTSTFKTSNDAALYTEAGIAAGAITAATATSIGTAAVASAAATSAAAASIMTTAASTAIGTALTVAGVAVTVPVAGWIISGIIVAAAAIASIITLSIMVPTESYTFENKLINWNYEESITTNFIDETSICHKCIRSKNCNKPKQSFNKGWYCKQWAEPTEVCSDIQM